MTPNAGIFHALDLKPSRCIIMNWLNSLYCRVGCSCPLPMSVMAAISHSPYILSWSKSRSFPNSFLLKCTAPRDICNLLRHDRECICSFRHCVNFRFLRLSSLFLSSILSFHAGHTPSRLSCRPHALAPFTRAKRPHTFHAGHAPSHLSRGPCALAPFMRANHAPPHAFHESTS